MVKRNEDRAFYQVPEVAVLGWLCKGLKLTMKTDKYGGSSSMVKHCLAQSEWNNKGARLEFFKFISFKLDF